MSDEDDEPLGTLDSPFDRDNIFVEGRKGNRYRAYLHITFNQWNDDVAPTASISPCAVHQNDVEAFNLYGHRRYLSFAFVLLGRVAFALSEQAKPFRRACKTVAIAETSNYAMLAVV